MDDFYDYDPNRDIMPRKKPRGETFVEFLDNISLHAKVWIAASIALPVVVGIVLAFNCLLNTTP